MFQQDDISASWEIASAKSLRQVCSENSKEACVGAAEQVRRVGADEVKEGTGTHGLWEDLWPLF